MNDVHFYRDLPARQLPLTGIFSSENFSDVPPDWHIIIADVKNSTQAVAAGKHNQVNLVAAGSLIVGLNVAKKHRLEVPFFFGGDGSTLLVPPLISGRVMNGLAAHSRNSAKNFGLEMHTGSLPVNALIENGQSLKLAKLQIDPAYSKAVAIGSGLRFAEQKIKQANRYGIEAASQNASLNLMGLECRWDKIKPRTAEAEIVCYLIEAQNPAQQLPVFAGVASRLEAVYGDLQKRNPLCLEKLTPLYSWQKLKQEMLVKFGKWKPAYFLDAFFRTLFGAFSFHYNWNMGGVRGKEYLAQLIAHADTLTIDGRITTIICGTPGQHQEFLRFLTQQEQSGSLVYGHHVSKESIMTCYIENRNARHVHFVDGADGGYTEASKELKYKLQNLGLPTATDVQ